MENLYLILVIVLFVLAISDLIVGVSNDAVNFLNSAIGSKAASYKVIMLIAALGVFVGASFSGGMMEVARKGIFHPEMFHFSEIMIIFFAVMITDVVLLDTFNSLGLPTSTTVSLVFELLGASVAVALVKVLNMETGNVFDYINSSKALIIIFGILFSVFVAFISGAIIQWISRFIFSFKLSRSIKYYGAIWGGIAITAITYFILVDGIKGSNFADYKLSNGLTLAHWVGENIVFILIVSFLFWTVLLQFLNLFFKINSPKIIVLVGTFALAMAFAGNDLVNFIGVPLAGYESFKLFIANPGVDPDAFLMAGLTGKVKTPLYFLLVSGLIMVITLYVSKKARKVIKTSVDLSRQGEGEERFGSNPFSKRIVRASILVNNATKAFLPKVIIKKIDRQFDSSRAEVLKLAEKDQPAFDLIRASVNLVIASILISLGTSMKLPLSTTYVTFMVAMGTSLADRAWGRDSAVFRLSGVVAVILGWFVTAFAAFAFAFIVALIIHWGGFIAIFGFIILGLYIVFRSYFVPKKETSIDEKTEDFETKEKLSLVDIYLSSTKTITKSFALVNKVISESINALETEDLKALRYAQSEVVAFTAQTKTLKDTIQFVMRKLDDKTVPYAHFYSQSLDFLREVARATSYIVNPCLVHIDNNHKSMDEFQMNDLIQLQHGLNDFYTEAERLILKSDYVGIGKLLSIEIKLRADIDSYVKDQIRRLTKPNSGKRNAKLFLDILSETKTLLLHSINLIKAQRDLAIGAKIYKPGK
ncbi:MAG: inorganic phosphate transporter [Bacteroidales bacterium]|nr:inorganic phosphate transporter [Bacteroidales bacterium]